MRCIDCKWHVIMPSLASSERLESELYCWAFTNPRYRKIMTASSNELEKAEVPEYCPLKLTVVVESSKSSEP